VAKRAATLSRRFALRGYDAVHCASAERINDDDVVAAAGDGKLLQAWSKLGLATFDANAEFSDDVEFSDNAEVELSD
jgi:predicted nucleic acid-binding protein